MASRGEVLEPSWPRQLPGDNNRAAAPKRHLRLEADFGSILTSISVSFFDYFQGALLERSRAVFGPILKHVGSILASIWECFGRPFKSENCTLA